MIQKITYWLVFIALSSFAFGQKSTNERIIFKHYSHNFGQLKFNEKAEYTFIFKNISDSSFVLTNVKTKCGCATSEWTKSPIPKRKKGEITITYDTSIIGRFSKPIIVYVSGSYEPVRLLITGNVIAPKPDDPEYENYIKKYPNRNH